MTPSTNLKADIERMDQLLECVEAINDERDSVPLLLTIRDLWPLIRDAIKTGVCEQGLAPK